MRVKCSHIARVLLVFGLPACAAPLAPSPSHPDIIDPPPSATDPSPYRLLTGDELEVTVKSAPELSRVVSIGPDGFVSIPYSGPVKAASLTLKELEAEIAAALSDTLRHPDVEIGLRLQSASK